jgi:hypothetical protein
LFGPSKKPSSVTILDKITFLILFFHTTDVLRFT